MQTAGSGLDSTSTGIYAMLRQSRVVIRGISDQYQREPLTADEATELANSCEAA